MPSFPHILLGLTSGRIRFRQIRNAASAQLKLVVSAACALLLLSGCITETGLRSVNPSNQQDEVTRLLLKLTDRPEGSRSLGGYTPAVNRLIEIGDPSLCQTLDFMLAPDEETRQHALRVISGVTMEMYGFKFGRGWPSAEDERSWKDFWKSMGDLRSNDPVDQRAEKVYRWKRWLMARRQ